ncbi:MAG: class I lanthipeptide [Tannerellaceae bacterium]|nr:class I lanthipeptide [Tannerellaceae bacterium]
MKKETISQLNDASQSSIKGGTFTTFTPPIYSVWQCSDITRTSKGAYCDIWSVSHDDGWPCLSRTGVACGDWCYGQG